jgi:hypothetical protein
MRLLREEGVRVQPGGDYDRWDLEARTGLIGAARVHIAIEEHGGGRQLLLVRVWPRCSIKVIAATLGALGFALGAGRDEAWLPFAVLTAFAAIFAFGAIHDCGAGVGAVARALKLLQAEDNAGWPGPGPGVTHTDREPVSLSVQASNANRPNAAAIRYGSAAMVAA